MISRQDAKEQSCKVFASCFTLLLCVKKVMHEEIFYKSPDATEAD